MGKLQIGEHLSVVDRVQSGDGFHLYDDDLFHKEIQPIPTVEFDTLIEHWNWLLPFKLAAAGPHFEGWPGFICRFEEARSQFLMDRNSAADNKLGYLLVYHAALRALRGKKACLWLS